LKSLDQHGVLAASLGSRHVLNQAQRNEGITLSTPDKNAIFGGAKKNAGRTKIYRDTANPFANNPPQLALGK
jgi:hypothetical protein